MHVSYLKREFKNVHACNTYRHIYAPKWRRNAIFVGILFVIVIGTIVIYCHQRMYKI
jgi:ABC-type multidrug transport system permease subunit